MNAAKRKSKKRSVANSQQPLDEVVLFLDRNLGWHLIADALRANGIQVEVHDDHLPQDAPDEDWIALVGRRQWIGVTKDRNVRHRRSQIRAIKHHNARVLVIRAKNATGPQMAEILVKAQRKIVRFASKNAPPFVAGIVSSGTITKYSI